MYNHVSLVKSSISLALNGHITGTVAYWSFCVVMWGQSVWHDAIDCTLLCIYHEYVHRCVCQCLHVSLCVPLIGDGLSNLSQMLIFGSVVKVGEVKVYVLQCPQKWSVTIRVCVCVCACEVCVLKSENNKWRSQTVILHKRPVSPPLLVIKCYSVALQATSHGLRHWNQPPGNAVCARVWVCCWCVTDTYPIIM